VLFLSGDLNSRCNYFLHLISCDNLNFIFGNTDYNGSTFDVVGHGKVNIRGNNYIKCLVNLCCLFDIHILNGRFPSDKDGEFTCVSNDDSSVVDFMIASFSPFSYIKDFEVLARDESDHFPIYCIFVSHKKSNNADSQTAQISLNTLDRYKWRISARLVQISCKDLGNCFIIITR
jgi:hypothetical protein